MGWSSGNEVFDPMARAMVDMVADGDLSPAIAGTLLEILILELEGRGWDTEDESLREFAAYRFIVDAFAACDIHLPDGEGPPRPEPITITVGGKRLVNLHCPEHGFLGVDTFDQTMANLNNHLTKFPDDTRREILLRTKETT